MTSDSPLNGSSVRRERLVDEYGLFVLAIHRGQLHQEIRRGELGDVILGIGDRAATSSSRIRRILSTYDEDEEITLRIMRDHDEITVTGRLGG